MAIPKQRGSGQYGGDRHRSNKGAFRASGGSVPPKKSCLLLVMIALFVPVALTAGLLVL